MQYSRRSFLMRLTGTVSVLLGGAQLPGCLGESDAQNAAATEPAAQADLGGSNSPGSQAAPATLTPPTVNAGPIWQTSPVIDFVEGVPAVVSIRSFVSAADVANVVITLVTGTLLPGITWNPNNATLAYDGRPLGATSNAPVVVNDITFAADDRRN